MQNPSPMGVALTNYPSSQPTSVHQGPINLGNHPQLHVEGYPKLAFFFSQCTRYLHIRRFSAIAVRLLLYQQHNLAALESRLLSLEAGDIDDNNPNDPSRQPFCADFAHLKAAPSGGNFHEQLELYRTLKHEMKEYEEAIIRFDRLGSKSYGLTELRTIQWFQAKRNGSYRPLAGLDASVWGSVTDPQGHASDIIQVVEQPSPSAIGRIFREKILIWAPRFPSWLYRLVFWSKKRPDVSYEYDVSAHTIDVIFLGVGNVVTSLLVYGAVTSLYFVNGKAASVGGVIVIAVVISVCSILFRNRQFITMLAT